MAQIKIFYYGLGDEKIHCKTIYVDSHDGQVIADLMKKHRMPPSGWRAGLYYSADIDPNISHRNAMSLENFEAWLNGK